MRRRNGRPRRRRGGADRGSAALFIAVFAPAMIFMAGLVIDGGSALEARQRAADMAEQAARAASNECDEALLRSRSECRVTDFGRARSTAGRYVANGEGVDWDLQPFSPVPGQAGQYYGVRVTVRIEFRTVLLGIVPAFRTIQVEESATAVAVTGL